MFSIASLYGLRGVACLAQDPDRPQFAHDLAAQIGIESGYLNKVMSILARRGYLQARRGRTGGFSLRRDPADISMLDIVNAIEPIGRVMGEALEPFEGNRSGRKLKAVVDQSLKDVNDRLASTSIADLAAAMPRKQTKSKKKTTSRKK
jgi:Rrf2 family nitric oxide-sensitive transcriptional repressor